MNSILMPTVVLNASVLGASTNSFVTEKVKDATVTYTFAWWTPIACLIVGIGFAALGYFMIGRAKSFIFSYGWFIPAFLVLFLGLPATLQDRLIVDDQHFELRTGFWLSPYRHNIRFDETRSFELSTFVERGRRGRKQNKLYLMVYPKAGGEAVKLALGELMQQGLAEIIVRAMRAGTPVIDNSDVPVE